MKIAIIGGGSAGLACAVSVAQAVREAGLEGKIENKINIILLEKQQRVGRKLLATGNGRCNLGNTSCELKFYHSTAPEVLAQILQIFDSTKTIEFFRNLGLLLHEEEGRLYPYSQQASAVLDVLRRKAEESGVSECCGHHVVGIKIPKTQSAHENHEGPLTFTLTLASGEHLTAERVIVACGGLAAPQMGSGGDGYRLLRECGHTLEPTFPALVSVKIADPALRALKGLRVKALVELLTPVGECLGQERGEVQFTEYGVSGIAVMQVSRHVGRLERELLERRHDSRPKKGPPKNRQEIIQQQASHRHKDPGIAHLRLDLLESWQEEELTRWLGERVQNAPMRKLEDFLVGIVPKRVGQILLRHIGLDLRTTTDTLTQEDTRAIAHILKNWLLPISATTSWQHAQVTAGGIHLNEFIPQTLESRLVPGLYAAGEVLDVDGNCGGYNLQWAWASGYLAGRAAALSFIQSES